MSNKNIWIPEEHRGRDTVAFKIPLFGWAVTNRFLLYFGVTSPVGLIVFFALIILDSTKDAMSLSNAIIWGAAVPIIAGLFSNHRIKGKKIEEVLKVKLQYRTNAHVSLNEKALRAIQERKNR